LTLRQANELGGHVRKGEESTIVVLWRVDDLKENAEEADQEQPSRRRDGGFCCATTGFGIWSNVSFPQAVLDLSFRRLRLTSTIRSKPQRSSLQECRTRLKFSMQVQKRSTVRSLTE
jgi:hypothetical protein